MLSSNLRGLKNNYDRAFFSNTIFVAAFSIKMQRRRVLFLVLVISLKIFVCGSFYFTDFRSSYNQNRFDPSDEFKKSSENPEESGGFFEGDMKLNREQLMNLEYGPRNGLISRQFRWPKSQGKIIVYYGFKSKHFSKLNIFIFFVRFL